MKSITTLLLSLSILAGLAAARPSKLEGKPPAEEGYLGLSLRDLPGGHTVISWVFPGPLSGEGIVAPATDLARPDLLVAVDGEAMNAKRFDEYIRGLAPGTTVKLETRRSNQRGGTIPDALDHQEEVRVLEVVLDSREEWTGTIHCARARDVRVSWDHPALLRAQDAASPLGQALVEHELVEPLATLCGVFTDTLAKNDDYHSLSRVRAPFEDPFCLPELEQLVSGPTRAIPGEPLVGALRLMVENLDLDPELVPAAERAKARAEEDPLGPGPFSDRLPGSSGLPADFRDAAFARECLSFLRVPKRTFYLAGPETRDHVRVIRRSMEVDWDEQARAFAKLFELSAEMGTHGNAFYNNLGPADTELPAGAVEGEVLFSAKVDEETWLVVGGPGPNRYDTAKIALIVDRGGDDEYWASDFRLGTRVIIDLAGNDHYTGTPDQGPGSALCGLSLIDDLAGNDRYEGELLSCGAAMFGVSLLLDRGGNDVYRGSEWSIGAACYGAGMLIDLGGGNDEYLGDFLCEGVGGPRGFGCIVDENGRDLYRANGPTPSAYGTAAVAQSFSQGMGFGYRQYAAGGIGLISDLGGDDRYEAGEFAQGGAYYWGLGVLHDAAGRDLYYGNRYGQGFGVHQAAGILADDAGDDTYWSMTAASQGAAWDIGVGLLIDRAGNDSYQCDGLGQGGASMQAIALLLDQGGVDRYVARGGGIQGLSGGNSYHYHEVGAFSFSLLMDSGGELDFYSTGRKNDAVSVSGSFNEADPKSSSLHGLVIDR